VLVGHLPTWSRIGRSAGLRLQVRALCRHRYLPATSERRRDPDDRRRHRVQITRKGQGALARTEPARRAIEEEILGALSAEERATLASLLSRAVYGLQHVGDDQRS
jgi:DNA-binding PadR family transcriptional regulator